MSCSSNVNPIQIQKAESRWKEDEKAESREQCRVLATGGLAGLIAPESKTIDEVDGFLTLDGLRILYERNR